MVCDARLDKFFAKWKSKMRWLRACQIMIYTKLSMIFEKISGQGGT